MERQNLINRIIGGIYKAMDTPAPCIMAQEESITQRPCVKIVVNPVVAEVINVSLIFYRYEVAVGYYTADQYKYENEAIRALEDFLWKLSGEIELDGGLFIGIDELQGFIGRDGEVVIRGIIEIDVARDERDEICPAETMEELELELAGEPEELESELMGEEGEG